MVIIPKSLPVIAVTDKLLIGQTVTVQPFLKN